MTQAENAGPVIRVKPGGEVVRARPGETILDGLYRSGYAYRTGCRRGGCGICKVDLLDGEVTYNRTVAETVLTPQERAEGTCLSCRAVPTGEITIALREETLRQTNPFLSALLGGAAYHPRRADGEQRGGSERGQDGERSQFSSGTPDDHISRIHELDDGGQLPRLDSSAVARRTTMRVHAPR